MYSITTAKSTTNPSSFNLSNQQKVEALLDINRIFRDNSSHSLFMNMATRYPKSEGLATTLGHLVPSEATLDMAKFLTTKAILPSNGNCVIGKEFQAAALEYIRYAESVGLISANASRNLVIVNDPTHVRGVFAEIKKTGKAGVLYLETESAYGLAHSEGLSLHGCGLKAAREAVSPFSNKTIFRNQVEGYGGSHTYNFPRCVITPTLAPPERLRASILLKECCTYYSNTSIESEPILFIQSVEAAGGRGNLIVYRGADNSLSFDDFTGNARCIPHSDEQLEQLLAYLESAGQNIEVAPYFRKSTPTSIQIIITESGGYIMRPFGQISEPVTNAFLGSTLDIDSSDINSDHMQIAITLTERFSQTLHSLGFRGYYNVDLLEYENPHGDSEIILSEANMRRSATSFLIGVVAEHAQLAQLFVRDNLSLYLNDHFSLPLSLYATKDVEGLLEILKSADIPVFTKEDPYGVLFLSPLLADSNHMSISMGIIARTDEEKAIIVEKLSRLTMPN